jgi:tRNA U34 5-methylaminomethyl-2-thiouridine-forming methyltransferase MnmC
LKTGWTVEVDKGKQGRQEMLTVADLKEQLADMPEDAEVRLAFQPNYPLEYSTQKKAVEVVTKDGIHIVYIAEKMQIGYLDADAAAELGW